MQEALEHIATAVRARHEPGVAAVLAYGSCLRDNTAEGLIDLYVLTDDYTSVSQNRLSRFFCRLVPPNVQYAETQWNGRTLRSKYAVLPLSRFEKLTRVSNPYVWARFGQPCRVVFARDRLRVEAALASARKTLWRNAEAISQEGDDALAAVTRLFVATYGTELRPESASRASLIVRADAGFYKLLAPKDWRSKNRAPADWRWRKIWGKALSVARLVKAGFTFQGGADYIAWKIERHSGVRIPVADWQRRHPVLGALWILPRVLARKAVR